MLVRADYPEGKAYAARQIREAIEGKSSHRKEDPGAIRGVITGVGGRRCVNIEDDSFDASDSGETAG